MAMSFRWREFFARWKEQQRTARERWLARFEGRPERPAAITGRAARSPRIKKQALDCAETACCGSGIGMDKGNHLPRTTCHTCPARHARQNIVAMYEAVHDVQ